MRIRTSSRIDDRHQVWLLLKQWVPKAEFSAVLEDLNSTTSQVLGMAYEQGYSLAEISEKIGKSVSVIRNHRNKGIFKLKQHFREQLEIAKICHAF